MMCPLTMLRPLSSISSVGALRHGVPSSPRRLWVLWWMMVGLLLFGGVSPSSAEELLTVEDIDALCVFSPLLDRAQATRGTQSDLVLLSASRRTYAAQRAERLFDTYRVRVVAEDYHIVQSDDVEVIVGAYGPLSISESHRLELGKAEIVLPVEEGSLSDIELGHAVGLVVLELDFQLAAQASTTEYCREVGERVLIEGELLHARLVHTGTDEVLAGSPTEEAKTRQVRYGFANQPMGRGRLLPKVELTRVECVFGAEDDAEDDAEGKDVKQQQRPLARSSEDCLGPLDAERLRNEVESTLLSCYVDAIMTRGRRQGALTFRARLLPEGGIEAPHVSVDVLVSEAISECSIARLSQLQFGALNIAQAVDLSLVVIFKTIARP